jgi:hypothetical protein
MNVYSKRHTLFTHFLSQLSQRHHSTHQWRSIINTRPRLHINNNIFTSSTFTNHTAFISFHSSFSTILVLIVLKRRRRRRRRRRKQITNKHNTNTQQQQQHSQQQQTRLPRSPATTDSLLLNFAFISYLIIFDPEQTSRCRRDSSLCATL